MFGLDFSQTSLLEAISILSEEARGGEVKLVFTPNVDHLVLLEENNEFKRAYQEADFILADGMPVVWFSRLIGKRLPERVAGADLFPGLCGISAQKRLRVFLLGGDPKVTPETARKLTHQFPGLLIAGIATPPIGFEKDVGLNLELIDSINKSSPDILFIALGAPKQEIWSYHHRKQLNVGLIIGVGGAFDLVAEVVPRAPHWIRSAGFEWLWRLSNDPRRLWRRYLIRDLRFFGIAFQEWRKQRDDQRNG